jgi:DNA ligase (NAD+)
MKQFLEDAAIAYYSGFPFLTDAEFDRLAEIHNYNSVGHKITDGIAHMYPMFSLQKAYSQDEIPSHFSPGNHTITTKLDGAAISLLYSNGKLQLALTRGDGKVGQDITAKMQYLVPVEITTTKTIQITGEVVAPKSIPNARNYAAGSLNLKDLNDFKSRPLSFFAYECTPNTELTYVEQLGLLKLLGFRTVLTDETEEFPNDGEVMRINDYKTFQSLGYTAHHPRGAVALKTIQEGVVTKLLDVVWQVGKSGVVSPVAILEPVLIGEATVSRATLHNIQYIEELGLDIGCNVEVIRSGEIIPRVVRRVA